MGSLQRNTGGACFSIETQSWFVGPDVVGDFRREYTVMIWLPAGGMFVYKTTSTDHINRLKAQAVYHGSGIYQFISVQEWREKLHRCLVHVPGSHPSTAAMFISQVYAMRKAGIVVRVLR